MWDFLVSKLNGGLAPSLQDSFYVGGAAGRPQEGTRRADHADYDIKFAQNLGLKFIIDEDFFLSSSCVALLLPPLPSPLS